MSGRAGRKYRIRKRRRLHQFRMAAAFQDYLNFMEGLEIVLDMTPEERAACSPIFIEFKSEFHSTT